jgi:hypothetical protein
MVRPRRHALIADKSLSDVVEAPIGVHLAKNGHMAAAKFLSWMGLDLNPETPIEEIISFKEKSPAWRTLKIRKLLHKSRGHLRKP